ncbi:hypothetical protein [Geobacillus sp. LEMMY01]|uniref:hypothetical protein n=1 Tax=Geobacillus sp. LEMMY01 TaxID=1954237 RepID=UPI0009ABFD7A|nr:hypothetical protein [Geobacillus sp. LEMMY01]OPX03593.1 hypothetical protein B1A75_07045 [Geobacillus sp. LEMMY01]
MGRIKWKKIILLVLLLLLCLPLGGTHSLAAEEEKGFVIHADKVVGILDLGGIILGSPKVIVGKLPIAFIQADISGLSMEQVIDTPQGTMVLSIRSGGKASATWMKLDVTKLTFGGLCFDGFPIKQCLKDVTLVVTKLTASRLSIPDMSLSTSFDGAAIAQAERQQNALEQTDVAKEAERLIWQLDEQQQGDDSAAQMVKTLQADVPALAERVKERENEWRSIEEKRGGLASSLEQLEAQIADKRTVGSGERKQYETILAGWRELKQKGEEQLAATNQDVAAWEKQKNVLEKAAAYVTEKLKLGEQSEAMKAISSLRVFLEAIQNQLDGQVKTGEIWQEGMWQLERRLGALAEWFDKQNQSEESGMAEENQPSSGQSVPSPDGSGEGNPPPSEAKP